MKYYILGLISLALLNGCTIPPTPIENHKVVRLEPRAPKPMVPYLSRLTGLVINNLSARHVKPHALDDQLSKTVYDRFIEIMDPFKIYFTQEDLAQFKSSYGKLDDEIKMGYVAFPFSVSEVASRRAEEFLIFAQDQLDKGVNCNVDTYFVYDFEKADFPKNNKEQEALWLNFIRNELVRLRLQKRALAENVKLPGIKPDIPYIATIPESERAMVRLRQMTQSTRNSTQIQDMEYFINALSLSFDPHCNFSAPKTFNRRMSSLNLSFCGIGIAYTVEDGVVIVGEVLPTGPTAIQKADLKVGDIIISVAEEGAHPVSLKGLGHNSISDLIRGPAHSSATLEIIDGNFPDSPMRTVTIKRGDIISTPSLAKGIRRKIKLDNGKIAEIGIITLPIFYQMPVTNDSVARGCSDDIRTEIQALQKQGKLDGIILDLRSNPGGFLPEAIKTVGLFVDSGPVVQIKSRNRIDILNDENNTVAYDGPLICMISRQSASASEIVSGALKDYERAIIIGDEQTYGKGTVQNVINLDAYAKDLALPIPVGGINLTTAKFYRVNGETTQLEGVASDIIIPSPTQFAEKLGERYTKNPLDYDTIAKANYKPYKNSVAPYLAGLKRKSNERIKNHPWFIYFLDLQEKNKAKSEKKKKEGLDSKLMLNESKRFEELLEIRDEMDLNNKKLETIRQEIKKVAPSELPTPTDDMTLEEGLNIMKDYLDLKK